MLPVIVFPAKYTKTLKCIRAPSMYERLYLYSLTLSFTIQNVILSTLTHLCYSKVILVLKSYDKFKSFSSKRQQFSIRQLN